jgi:hypothetical protein
MGYVKKPGLGEVNLQGCGRAGSSTLHAAFTASARIGPSTIWSISQGGMLGRAASAGGALSCVT